MSPPSEKHSVTLIAGTTNDNFYVTMNCGAKAEAARLGLQYDHAGPSNFDAGQQIPIVNSVRPSTRTPCSSLRPTPRR